MKPWRGSMILVAVSAGLLAVSVLAGSTGWRLPGWGQDDAAMALVLWDIRAPRGLGAWLAGALLGLAGAMAQGLFRNPLADPYLLGSSSGAALGVAACLAAWGVGPAAAGWATRFGLTGAAFAGAVLAVLLTLALARGVQHTLRLLLAGVVVGVVLGACSSLTMLLVPDIMRAMQAFLLGTTGFLGWSAVQVLAPALVVAACVAWGCARSLDALSLGDATARSLGVRMPVVRVWMIAAMSLATGAAVAQAGLISFVGLVAPHLVRARVHGAQGPLMMLSALVGGVLLLAADTVARLVMAPQELPVGVLTAVLGGGYLLWRMHRMERVA